MKFLLISLLSLLLFSCNSRERMVKKFFKRVNANEVNAASKYVWPEDYNKLYVFNKRFLENNPLTNFEIIEVDENEDKNIVTAKIQLLNAKQELVNYFDSSGLVKSNNEYILNFEIRKANENEYISLPFESDSTILPLKHLKLSSVKTEMLNLRNGPGINYKVQGNLKQYDEILIDNSYVNQDWRRGFVINENSNVTTVYLSSKFTDLNEISFFSLGYFAKLSFITLFLIGVIVCIIIYPLILVGCFSSAGEAPMFALILFLLIIGSLFFTYQLFENFLFELFLINIPY